MNTPVNRGIKGVLFHSNGKMKSPVKGIKQIALLPFAIVYGIGYTLCTGIPRKLVGKTFLESAEPPQQIDYYGYGM
jgi:hypothetical protein